ncbi:peptide/nickel transport system ATP-binding protein [Acetoanaerobium noterae]|uniref:Oligopeptide transporter subunit ATP-binding component of ABC superfamily n=2 Tax=Acetoanaerobium TaxID=186831 RepID=E3PUC9_ACESD|nr:MULTISPECIES: dipeptide ABC transporter ATP-binding protein [Acetoanaerobium]MBP8762552.1 dipeptide ABC transporter ATP-binding protein [Acetoanaerobium sp.]MBP9499820.1 dipeptide ABC transporter ATP-binding protein [Acetoanaerobium sp.]MBP9562218.1 dipeptide ABC transporter ATP-binding protein [Acetoanaerobium sp.]CBH22367.1 oligopeptide transporter subunit; ATP-binding component of ABC superfamily [Acetoanaerobium sticklandii]SKB69729.1 peptide/nickel transport system ATP-binding protein 
MSEIILSVRDLKKYFPIKAGVLQKTVGHVKAVDGVSFDIVKGETLGIVGESGCGKSTTGRAIIRLFEKTGGDVYFNGKEVHSLNHKELRAIRPKMQMIFQDPYSSLNPRMTVGQIVGEALLDHGIITDKVELRKKVMKTIEECGLASYHIDRYPHEFSGGQRQRIGIARALALDPDFIIADEPVSALDVSIQAQIINLLMDLQKERGFTYLFISHDLSVVEHISTRVGVMYLGSMVELANKKDMYKNPLHPYTQALLSAAPVPDPTAERKRIILTGDIPSPANPPSGCKFHTRCPYAMPICKTDIPEFKDRGNKHFVACHLLDKNN